MLAGADLVAFVGTRDLDLSARFYGEVLGLDLIGSSTFANVYSVGGTELRVTLVDQPAAVPYTVLGFKVSDIVEAIGALREAGVVFNTYEGMNQDGHVWTSPDGAKVAWFADPDENTLSIQQPT